MTEIEAVELYLDNLKRLENAEIYFYNLDLSDKEYFDNPHWGSYFEILQNCKKIYPLVKNFEGLSKLAKERGLSRYKWFERNKYIKN